MAKRVAEQDVCARSGDDSEDVLVARIALDRREGRDTTEDVDALLRLAGEKNRAALDRLAK